MFIVKRHITCFRKCKLTVTRDNDKLSYKVTRTHTDATGNTYTFNMFNTIISFADDISNRSDFTDYVQYGLYARNESLTNLDDVANIFDMAGENTWTVADLKTAINHLLGGTYDTSPLSSAHLVNMTAASLATKTNLNGLRNVIPGTRLLHMLFPLKTTPLSTVPLSVAAYPGSDVSTTEEIISSESDAILTNSVITEWTINNNITPSIKITSDTDTVAKDKNVTLNVTVTDTKTGDPILGTVELYVEHINGYVPYSRLLVVDGVASLPVSAMLMQPDDTIRIKLGFKYYTNMCEKTLTVVKK